MKQKRTGLRSLSVLLSVCLLLSLAGFSTSASAADDDAHTSLSRQALPPDAVLTPVLLNGEEILPGECYRMDGVTYVPLRRFCELLAPNAQIRWESKTKTALIQTDGLSLSVPAEQLYITANGHVLYTVGAVKNRNGHLYVPVRPLARAFAIALDWNAATCSVALTKHDSSTFISRASYDPDALYWLSRIISSEASVEPFVGQIAVGNVVLNRVRHAQYPNTIYGVIFDRKYGTQFSPVAFGTIYNAPSESAILAAKICLEGYSVSDTALFFFNPTIAVSDWISRSCTFEFRIGAHEFYH